MGTNRCQKGKSQRSLDAGRGSVEPLKQTLKERTQPLGIVRTLDPETPPRPADQNLHINKFSR